MKQKRVRQGLQDIFGPHVGIGFADPASKNNELVQAERDAALNMVPKRLREFAAGRAAARAALSEVGHAPVAIPRSLDRSPVWPAGIVGSITHCETACVSVASRIENWRSIGLDIEDDAPLHREAWPIILTEEELNSVEKLPRWRRARRIKILFSIKEAVYKAQYPITGEIFDFHTLETQLESNRFLASFTRDVGRYQKGVSIGGGFFEVDKYVIAGAQIVDS